MRLMVTKSREEADPQQETGGRWKQFVESAARKAQETVTAEPQTLDSFLDDTPDDDWRVDSGATKTSFAEPPSPILENPRTESPRINIPRAENSRTIESPKLEAPRQEIPRPQMAAQSVARPTRSADLSQRFGGKVTSALSQGTLIEGKFSFDAPVQVDGTLKGEITANSALIVGEHATIEAQCRVGNLIVFGTVRGDVEASDTVEIKRGGSLIGKISSRGLIIDEGGSFEGECKRIRGSV